MDAAHKAVCILEAKIRQQAVAQMARHGLALPISVLPTIRSSRRQTLDLPAIVSYMAVTWPSHGSYMAVT